MDFSALGLGPDVLRAVEEMGYVQPTPIQEQAIPFVLRSQDVLGCAQTGTGKTASFTLPMIDILSTGRARARMPRSLILEPTRELATQVAENFRTYGKYTRLSMALLIGGESFGDQVKALDRGVDVLIATPGRMIDLFERGNIMLSDIRIFVIDEADRMLDMGFIPDIEKIAGLLPPMKQTLFFSATMPPEIKRLADRFLHNPREISVAPPASPSETVEQAMAIVATEDKRQALRKLLDSEDVKNAFIFCNRKKDVAILHRSLEKHGYSAGSLHGDMPQFKRTEMLDGFRRGDFKLLVCSDVAARGLDIAGLSHVFNFDVPVNAEDYVHRIGRTGRAGLRGRAFTLAQPEDFKQVKAIETLIKREVPRIGIDGMDNLELDPDARPGRGGGRAGRDAATRSTRGRGAKPAAEPRETPAPTEADAAEEAAPGTSSRRRRSRGERNAERSERPERAERSDRSERPERPERSDRSDRNDRSDRADRNERADRPERSDRSERFDRPERSERFERNERPERFERSERRGREEGESDGVPGFGDHVPEFMKRAVVFAPISRLVPDDVAAEPASEVDPDTALEAAASDVASPAQLAEGEAAPAGDRADAVEPVPVAGEAGGMAAEAEAAPAPTPSGMDSEGEASEPAERAAEPVESVAELAEVERERP